jgi:LexA DNA binding domain-containing protein
MKPPYTSRQGQFLAYINHYITLHGRPPAEAEMMQFFQVTPPSVHQMILTLERRGLISRVPGQARSIALRLPAEKLPPLHSASATATINPTSPKTGNHPPTDMETTLLRFGKGQLEHWFNHNDQKPLDDSEFVPLLDMLIDSFARAGLSATHVQQLRRHACEVYHRYCQQAEPETTFEENIEIMLNNLPPPLKSRWQKALT